MVVLVSGGMLRAEIEVESLMRLDRYFSGDLTPRGIVVPALNEDRLEDWACL